MQEKLTVARPYAAAAFDYAAEQGDIEAWSSMLAALAEAVQDSSLAACIGHPKVSDAQLRELLTELLGGRLNEARGNFLGALIEAERLELAPQIAELFERRKAAAAGVLNVEVVSAFPLSDSERQKIDQALQARFGRSCSVEAKTDSALIGGAVVRIGDSVIDLSLKGRLATLEQQIA